MRTSGATGFGYAHGAAAVAICMAELNYAAHEFPLAFLPLKEGLFSLVGLLKPPIGRPLLSTDGRWLGSYVPALLRAHPFTWQTVKGKVVLCIDETSPILSEHEGDLLFNEDGSPSPRVSKAADFIRHLVQQFKETDATAQSLEQHGLLEEWFAPGAAEGLPPGLRRVSEQRLRGLDGAALQELVLAGGLSLAYAQILSCSLVGRPSVETFRPKLETVDQSSARLRDMEFTFD